MSNPEEQPEKLPKGLRRKSPRPNTQSGEIVPAEVLSHTPSAPERPTRDQLSAEIRTKQVEVLYQQLKLREATEADIPEINQIYDQLYYDRSAFELLANSTLRQSLDQSGESEDQLKVARALKEVSGGGEFAHISEEEWKERIHTPGERVLVMTCGDSIIGVNSYCLGPHAEEQISDRFNVIKKNETGEAWEKTLRNHEASNQWSPRYRNIIMIHDTFFNPKVQGRGLFQRFYEMMIDFELEQATPYITPEELPNWVIYYFVNRFESIFMEGDSPESDLHLADRIQSNNATIGAGLKFGGTQIGITPAISVYGKEPLKVPNLPGKMPEYLENDEGKKILVYRGYLDMLISVQTMLRHKRLREAQS